MTDIIAYDFFQRAVLVALLASVSCGIMGTYIVSKRIVFISDGITHASFGGIGLGYFLGISPILSAAAFSIMSAFGIKYLTTRIRVREDSSIGIFLAMGMATGVILIYLTPGYAPDLSSYLFGNILTVTASEVYFSMSITALTVLVALFFYREILSTAFDEEYGMIQDLNTALISYLMLALIALVVVINIRIAGIILIISLLTIPQNTALLFTSTFKNIIVLSILIGLISALAGLIISFYFNIPSGASIVFSEAVIFLIC
ncbi:MAG: iron chelate uptake ABC transporter family permease subunit, partial [Candidatus Delongbacteria bacterium]